MVSRVSQRFCTMSIIDEVSLFLCRGDDGGVGNGNAHGMAKQRDNGKPIRQSSTIAASPNACSRPPRKLSRNGRVTVKINAAPISESGARRRNCYTMRGPWTCDQSTFRLAARQEAAALLPRDSGCESVATRSTMRGAARAGVRAAGRVRVWPATGHPMAKPRMRKGMDSNHSMDRGQGRAGRAPG